MKNIIKNILLSLYVHLWSPFRNFIRSITGRSHVTILVYHRVNDNYRDSVTVGVEQFKRQIRIAQKQYDFLTIDQFIANKAGIRRKPALLITFDDGYADNYNAAEFLHKQGISALFFLTTRIVGTNNPFPHDIKRLGKRVKTLSWDQVHQMAKWGHRFGSHTAEHLNLSRLEKDEAIKQIQLGQTDLVQKIGQYANPELFAYPHGRIEDLPESIGSSLKKLGIKFCFSAHGGVNMPNFDPYDIKRQGVDHGFSDLAFLAALEGWRVRLPKR